MYFADSRTGLADSRTELEKALVGFGQPDRKKRQAIMVPDGR